MRKLNTPNRRHDKPEGRRWRDGEWMRIWLSVLGHSGPLCNVLRTGPPGWRVSRSRLLGRVTTLLGPWGQVETAAGAMVTGDHIVRVDGLRGRLWRRTLETKIYGHEWNEIWNRRWPDKRPGRWTIAGWKGELSQWTV